MRIQLQHSKHHGLIYLLAPEQRIRRVNSLCSKKREVVDLLVHEHPQRVGPPERGEPSRRRIYGREGVDLSHGNGRIAIQCLSNQVAQRLQQIAPLLRVCHQPRGSVSGVDLWIKMEGDAVEQVVSEPRIGLLVITNACEESLHPEMTARVLWSRAQSAESTDLRPEDLDPRIVLVHLYGELDERFDVLVDRVRLSGLGVDGQVRLIAYGPQPDRVD